MTVGLSDILKNNEEFISSKELTKQKILTSKLKQMANFLEKTYGGFVFM
jgi:hypothetical protein